MKLEVYLQLMVKESLLKFQSTVTIEDKRVYTEWAEKRFKFERLNACLSAIPKSMDPNKILGALKLLVGDVRYFHPIEESENEALWQPILKILREVQQPQALTHIESGKQMGQEIVRLVFEKEIKEASQTER